MAWFRVDDQAAFHAKILTAGNEAFGALVRAGAWSSAHGTDGRIPRAVALTIAPERVWRRLVEARLSDDGTGLAIEIEGGWQIHDYLAWNPSAEDVRAERARKAANIASYRARKQPVSDGVTDGVTGHTSDTNRGPIPIPRSHTHTPGAREDGPESEGDTESANPPASSPRSSPKPAAKLAKTEAGLQPEARQILEALRSDPVLEPAANAAIADRILGRSMNLGTKVEWVVAAIGDAARDLGAAADTGRPEPPAVVVQTVVRYCDRAKPREMPAAERRRGGAGTGIPPVQPQAKPGEYDWRKDAEKTRAEKFRELEKVAAELPAAVGGGGA